MDETNEGPLFPVGQPTVGGRACVAHAALTLSFLSREQRDHFVKGLLADEMNFDFTVETVAGDSRSPTLFQVMIADVAWGQNLVRLARLAQRCDYNAGSA